MSGWGTGAGLSSFAAHDMNIVAVPQIRMAASIQFIIFIIVCILLNNNMQVLGKLFGVQS